MAGSSPVGQHTPTQSPPERRAARVACIGGGPWGSNLIRNYAEIGALHGICDASPTRLQELEQQYPHVRCTASFHEALTARDVDAIVVATPSETHVQLVRDGIEAGKDVYVEKPFCLSSREARQLADLARGRGRILMVGHLLWYHPALLKLKAMVDAGELGRIQYIYTNRLNFGRLGRRENVLWSLAPHDVSVILGLLEGTPEDVDAVASCQLVPRKPDTVVATLTFGEGVRAHVFVSWLHPTKEQRIVVVGDRQMAVFDDGRAADKLVVYPHVVEWHHQRPLERAGTPQPVPYEQVEPLKAECLHFLSCIADRSTPRTDAEEGVRVVRVLERLQMALERPTATSSVQSAQRYFAHPSAFIDDEVEIGEGTRIWHVSHVMAGCKVGRNCNIGQNVVIGPRVTIGDGVKI